MRTRKLGEQGMTLIEVLVATAVLAVVILIALAVYDASRGAFKKGENATTQQESVRIAYDRIVADLRMVGYNSDPDGNPARPDEKLEVALDHAIIFRGDFDADDSAKKNDHEGALAGGAFDVVTTGNDEVVGYVLSKPDGTGPDTITFSADVNDEPRDGNVAAVTINNVVLNPTSPPYTLYKISLNNNVGTCCNNDFIVRTPVIENVRNMTFQYYDPSGAAPIAAPGTAETAAVKTLRAGVNKFNVSLIGMTRDPDISYNDTTDAAARNYRKFELRGDVVPRNIRMKGVQDLGADNVPPNQPATPTLIAGHCGGFIVSWAPNAVDDGVSVYKINYGTAPGTVLGTKESGSSPYFLGGLTTGTTYYISIQAVDAAGNLSIKSSNASAVVANTNTPSAPTGASATGAMNYVRLNWTPVTTNTASVPAADPIAPTIRDLAGYRIYRGDASSVTATAANLVANETVVAPPSEPPHSDTTTVNCHTYHYKVTAVDTCGLESAPTAAFSGRATTTTPPEAPTNVEAHLAGSAVTVTWTAVTKDTSTPPAAITIGAYDVYRSNVMLRTDLASTAIFPSTPLATVTTPNYIDNALPVMTYLQTVYYMVKAKDECVNVSAPSAYAQGSCAFSGTLTMNHNSGEVVAGPVNTTVSVTGGTDTYTGITITYTHAVSGVTRTYTSATPGPTWSDTGWLAIPTGPYFITATVTNAAGCTSTMTVDVNGGSVAGCCLSIFPTGTSTIACSSAGGTKCKEVSYRMGNDHCLTAVALVSMSVGWIDYTNLHPRWQTARFNGTNIAAAGSWTTTYTGATNEVGTATKSNFSAPAPEVAYLQPMTSVNTTLVTYVFDNFTQNKVGSTTYSDVFDQTFVFNILDSLGNASGVTTTCTLPTLTVN